MTISSHVPAKATDLKQHTFSHRHLIPLQPDVLWRIERGAVRTLTWNEEGVAITLGYWGQGDVIGQPLSRLDPYEIECLTIVEASRIPSGQWDYALDAMRLHIQQTQELLNIVRMNPINQRLLKLLAWLSQKFGREVDSGKLIDLPLTHQAIAEAIGTTRVSVTRLLNQFEREGIINRYRRHFIVLRSVS
ncbi:MAG: Crp/Fnr family transcriptional regulator [Potamolinea sp.]